MNGSDPAVAGPSTAALTAASVALSIAVAYACGVTSAGLPLDNPHLWDALSRGSFLAHPPLRFVASCAPFLLGALALSYRALRTVPDDLPAFASPWRRLALVLAPVLLSPFALAQDDPWRRPALFAICVGASVVAIGAHGEARAPLLAGAPAHHRRHRRARGAVLDAGDHPRPG